MRNQAIQVIYFAPQLMDEDLAGGVSALHLGQLSSNLVNSELLIFHLLGLGPERLRIILQRDGVGGKLLMEPIV